MAEPVVDLKKNIKLLTQANKKLAASAKTTAKALETQAIATSQARVNTEGAATQLQKLTGVAYKDAEKAIKANTNTLKRNTEKIAVLKARLKDNGVEVKRGTEIYKLMSKAMRGNKTDMDRLSRATSILLREQKKLNKSYGEGIFQVRNFRNSSGKLGMSFSVLRSKILLVNFAINLLTGTVLVRAFKEFARQERAVSQLNKVLASTGYVARTTSIQMISMAKGLAGVTRFGDEAIIEMQKMMLTFTNIKDQVLPDAISLTLDMAEAFGTDAKTAAIQLGKALNDPEKGFTALRRIGISFSEEQERQIKNFARSNDLASAQGVILDELKREFGGVAQASGSASTKIAHLSEAWADFMERLGEAISPIISPVFGALTAVLNSTKSDTERLLETLGTLEQTDIVKESQINLLKQQGAEIENLSGIVDVYSIDKLTNWVDANERVRLEMEKVNSGIDSHRKSISEDILAITDIANANKMTIDQLREYVKENDLAIVSDRTRNGIVMESKANELKANLESMGINQELAETIKNLNQEDLNNIETLNTKKAALIELQRILIELGVIMEFQNTVTAENSMLQIENAAAFMSSVNQGFQAYGNMVNTIAMNEIETNRQRELSTARTRRQIQRINDKYDQQERDKRKEQADFMIAMAVAQGASAILDVWAAKSTLPSPWNTIAKVAQTGAVLAETNTQISTIKTQAAKFEQGGLVGGRRHSQGGTMINAEQGEFVMSRSAVQSVGLENLNRMNEGGGGGSAITVNVSGNVLSQDFVEGELAENIKEAIRRGTDFGIS